MDGWGLFVMFEIRGIGIWSNPSKAQCYYITIMYSSSYVTYNVQPLIRPITSHLSHRSHLSQQARGKGKCERVGS